MQGGIKLSKDKIRFIKNNNQGAPLELKKNLLSQTGSFATSNVTSPHKNPPPMDDLPMRQSQNNFKFSLNELSDSEKTQVLSLRAGPGLTQTSQPQMLGSQTSKANRGASFLFGNTQTKFDSNQTQAQPVK